MGMRIALAILALVLGSLPATAQSERVVALVVSVGDGTARADAVQTQLQLMGAETLRADGPNNAQLRSIVTRFAREAADSRATFVYLDAPAVNFEGRTFVLPKGATLKNPTDIFTQGIPIQAFARSSAQAEQGGAVAMMVAGQPGELPDALTVTDRAPESVPGSAAVLVAAVDAFEPLLAIVETAATQEEIELGAMLKQMSSQAGVTVSDIPRIPILLRIGTPPPAPARVDTAATTAPAIALPEAPATPSAPETASGEQSEPQETLEELTLLEQSISRAAKRSIQRKLRDLGHYKGLVDGIFGPQTRDAIKTFQTSRSEEPTGLLNRQQQLDLIS
ncbi:peptidoglycan-binding domain-containing protein [Rhizobium sp. GN54]|uniref:peptidoglycan-binding domain-containing protein n=1 Tax=Rhizobium sp. GN54 TaxID=2898150 RepID=UPI001E338BC6|nr:peptidoglycan-binding domain-containing protein [Rhizobium sp. GN54]MCD2184695.1 peptidoglycan-binding protein [Rhizobium sp. GN54]